MSKFLPLTRPHVASGRKIRCFRRKGETINQDILLEKRKTTEVMALSMYRVEKFGNLKTCRYMWIALYLYIMTHYVKIMYI